MLIPLLIAVTFVGLMLCLGAPPYDQPNQYQRHCNRCGQRQDAVSWSWDAHARHADKWVATGAVIDPDCLCHEDCKP